jgi:hypothetical protein
MKFEPGSEDGANASTLPAASTSTAGASADPPRPSGHTPHADGRALRRRARLRGWKLPIIDGPFAESKEL